MSKQAILLSGGIDSCSLAWQQKPKLAFHISYGQKSELAELKASSAIANEMKLALHLINIDCSSLGSGDLVGKRKLKIAPVSEWWPYRNQLLITLALMKAVSFNVTELMIGAVKTDKRHKDGSSEFFELINALSVYQEGHIRISSPAIHLDSIELIENSGVPASLLGWTHSCHKSNLPCGRCNGCLKHIHIKSKMNLI